MLSVHCLVEEKYLTLQVIYSLVKETMHPTQFACKASEIIIHHNQPWDIILSHLNELATEGLITFIVPSVITITENGIKKSEYLPVKASDQFEISKQVA